MQANYLGAFRITVATPGTYSLLAEALGYASAETGSFELSEGGVTTVDLSLQAEPMELECDEAVLP